MVEIFLSNGEDEKSLQRAKFYSKRRVPSSSFFLFFWLYSVNKSVLCPKEIRSEGKLADPAKNEKQWFPISSSMNFKFKTNGNKTLKRRKDHVVIKRDLKKMESPPCTKAHSANKPRPNPFDGNP